MCLCVSDLGLRHDIEVVVVRREGHVSEDGSILHRLHGLILQSKRGAVYPDLEKYRSTLGIHISDICVIFFNHCGAHIVSQVLQQNNIKKKHSKLYMKFINPVPTIQKVLITQTLK